MEPRLLIVETSGRTGQVALAQGATLLQARRLDESRRHARDLAPAVADLLAAQQWRPRDVQGIIVSRGPGSYTGLRVGIISCKVFAYATGCALLAVDTFAAIARQTPPEALRLEVVADAQQEKIYVQSFARASAAAGLAPVSALAIRPLVEWLGELERTVWISGPALTLYRGRLAHGHPVVAEEYWEPQPESLLGIGLARYHAGERDDPWQLEPLYLRPSAAEEKWATKRPDCTAPAR